MALHYDADNDGKYEASSDLEIYLARPTCAGAELWACPIELNGTYFFHDEGWEAGGEGVSFTRWTIHPIRNKVTVRTYRVRPAGSAAPLAKCLDIILRLP